MDLVIFYLNKQHTLTVLIPAYHVLVRYCTAFCLHFPIRFLQPWFNLFCLCHIKFICNSTYLSLVIIVLSLFYILFWSVWLKCIMMFANVATKDHPSIQGAINNHGNSHDDSDSGLSELEQILKQKTYTRQVIVGIAWNEFAWENLYLYYLTGNLAVLHFLWLLPWVLGSLVLTAYNISQHVCLMSNLKWCIDALL